MASVYDSWAGCIPAPSYYLILPSDLIEYVKRTNLYPDILLINIETGENDYSMFGPYAAEFKAEWDKYDALLEG